MVNPLELSYDQKEVVVMADQMFNFIVGMERLQRAPIHGGGPTQELQYLQQYLTSASVTADYADAINQFMNAVQAKISGE